MSVGPMGMMGSVVGGNLAQRAGSDVEQIQQEASDQSRRTESARNAEAAAGVGTTEQDQEASDRDADGRRPWEIRRARGRAAVEESPPADERLSRDPTGQSGANLDLTG